MVWELSALQVNNTASANNQDTCKGEGFGVCKFNMIPNGTYTRLLQYHAGSTAKYDIVVLSLIHI